MGNICNTTNKSYENNFKALVSNESLNINMMPLTQPINGLQIFGDSNINH